MEQNHKIEPKTCALQKKHCGGCPLLSQPYAAQLAAKQARLEKLLPRCGPSLACKTHGIIATR